VRQARHQVVAIWQGKADPGCLDLGARAGQTLAQRRGRDQEGTCHAPGIQPQHQLQHQGCAHSGVNGRVGTDEHQVERPVRGGSVSDVATFLLEMPEVLGGPGQAALGAYRVDGPVLCHRHQPGFGAGGHTVARPDFERPHERIRQRIQREGHAAGADGKQGGEPAM